MFLVLLRLARRSGRKITRTTTKAQELVDPEATTRLAEGVIRRSSVRAKILWLFICQSTPGFASSSLISLLLKGSLLSMDSIASP